MVSFLVTNVSVYAQSSQAPAQPVNKVLEEEKTTTSNARVASDNEGEVKGWFIPIAIGIGILLEEIIGPGLLGKGVDCVSDLHKCIEGANAVTQNYVYKANVGCDFVVPHNGEFQDECTNQKLQAYRDGTTPGPAAKAGILDMASGIANASMSLPVPIEGGQYFASINPFRQAQAQNNDVASQLASSTILMDIWTSVRNASYALMVLVTLVVGFMIMFRRKTDPRTAVTIQNSLPKIVVAMLLITFSFAIAGFMADLIRIISSIAIGVIGGQPFNVVAIFLLVIASMTGAGGAALAFLGGPTIIGIAVLFLSIILIAIVLAVFINLIFKIITRYVIFILMTLFAPMFFLVGALPGAEGIMLNWFKRTASALIAIPATAVMLQLSFRIGFEPILGHSSANLPMPYIVPNPLNSVFQWALIGPIVGLGIFFFATKVPDIVDELFGVKELGFKKGMGLGAVLGAPLAATAAVGNVGRGIRGVGELREGIGKGGDLLRNKGWGGMKSGITGLGLPTESVEKNKGVGAKLARSAAAVIPGATPRPRGSAELLARGASRQEWAAQTKIPLAKFNDATRTKIHELREARPDVTEEEFAAEVKRRFGAP